MTNDNSIGPEKGHIKKLRNSEAHIKIYGPLSKWGTFPWKEDLCKLKHARGFEKRPEEGDDVIVLRRGEGRSSEIAKIFFEEEIIEGTGTVTEEIEEDWAGFIVKESNLSGKFSLSVYTSGKGKPGTKLTRRLSPGAEIHFKGVETGTGKIEAFSVLPLETYQSLMRKDQKSSLPSTRESPIPVTEERNAAYYRKKFQRQMQKKVEKEAMSNGTVESISQMDAGTSQRPMDRCQSEPPVVRESGMIIVPRSMPSPILSELPDQSYVVTRPSSQSTATKVVRTPTIPWGSRYNLMGIIVEISTHGPNEGTIWERDLGKVSFTSNEIPDAERIKKLSINHNPGKWVRLDAEKEETYRSFERAGWRATEVRRYERTGQSVQARLEYNRHSRTEFHVRDFERERFKTKAIVATAFPDKGTLWSEELGRISVDLNTDGWDVEDMEPGTFVGFDAEFVDDSDRVSAHWRASAVRLAQDATTVFDGVCETSIRKMILEVKMARPEFATLLTVGEPVAEMVYMARGDYCLEIAPGATFENELRKVRRFIGWVVPCLTINSCEKRTIRLEPYGFGKPLDAAAELRSIPLLPVEDRIQAASFRPIVGTPTVPVETPDLARGSTEDRRRTQERWNSATSRDATVPTASLPSGRGYGETDRGPTIHRVNTVPDGLGTRLGSAGDLPSIAASSTSTVPIGRTSSVGSTEYRRIDDTKSGPTVFEKVRGSSQDRNATRSEQPQRFVPDPNDPWSLEPEIIHPESRASGISLLVRTAPASSPSGARAREARNFNADFGLDSNNGAASTCCEVPVVEENLIELDAISQTTALSQNTDPGYGDRYMGIRATEDTSCYSFDHAQSSLTPVSMDLEDDLGDCVSCVTPSEAGSPKFVEPKEAEKKHRTLGIQTEPFLERDIVNQVCDDPEIWVLLCRKMPEITLKMLQCRRGP